MENVFNVKYNTNLDRLQIPKESRVTKVINFANKHKFISLVFISFFILSTINFYLIYNFVKILENV